MGAELAAQSGAGAVCAAACIPECECGVEQVERAEFAEDDQARSVEYSGGDLSGFGKHFIGRKN